ncbi:MAG: ribosome maturation factor RimM [Deltaproteobacteria bacterium]|jgi:16S rRNA processing protein RimM|nr:ribosome maturation factor RimM [Deltaproteobacteria bacterium]
MEKKPVARKKAPPDALETAVDLVLMGRLGRAHGVHGEIRCDFYGEDPESLLLPGLLLSPPRKNASGKRETRPVSLQGFRPAARGLILRLKDVQTRDQASLLSSAELLLPRSSLPPLPDDLLYQHDLLGMRVLDPDRLPIGQVSGFISQGDSLILRVLSDSRRELLIPLRDEFVTEIDAEDKSLVTLPLAALEAFRRDLP